MSENVLVAIVVSVCASVFGWAVWVIAVNIRRSRMSKRVTELHAKLLDRFAASQDLIAFLEGEPGRRYFDALETEVRDPLNRILNGIQFGIVLILLGLSLLAVRTAQSDETARSTLLLTGIPGIALGAGFLLSAAISYRLGKAWGLFDKNRRQTP